MAHTVQQISSGGNDNNRVAAFGHFICRYREGVNPQAAMLDKFGFYRLIRYLFSVAAIADNIIIVVIQAYFQKREPGQTVEVDFQTGLFDNIVTFGFPGRSLRFGDVDIAIADFYPRGVQVIIPKVIVKTQVEF